MSDFIMMDNSDPEECPALVMDLGMESSSECSNTNNEDSKECPPQNDEVAVQPADIRESPAEEGDTKELVTESENTAEDDIAKEETIKEESASSNVEEEGDLKIEAPNMEDVEIEDSAKERDSKEVELKEEDLKCDDLREEETKVEDMKEEDVKEHDAKEEDPKEEDRKEEDTKEEDMKEEDTKEEDMKEEDVKEEDMKEEDVKEEDMKEEDMKEEDLKEDEDMKEEDMMEVEEDGVNDDDGDGKDDSDEDGKQKEGEGKQEKRERRKAKSKYNNMDNEDLEKMLKWKHGIGHLPGSNLKFRKSGTGVLEVITPISDEDDLFDPTVTTAIERKGKRKRGLVKRVPKRVESRCSSVDKTTPTVSPSVSPRVSPEDKKRRPGGGGSGGGNNNNKKKLKFGSNGDDEMLKCETCGCYGLISEFRSSGRFCSQRCASAYGVKRRAEMIAEQLAAIEKEKTVGTGRSGKKKKRKGGTEPKDSSPFRTRSPSVDSSAGETVKMFFPDDAKLYYEVSGHDDEFDWDDYLKITGTKPVPLKSFVKDYADQELFPRNAGLFHPKMKLECIDPRHQSCIAVVSIVEVQGARIRLHFDGWSENYDFWIHTNSPFIFPCGWCEKNGQKLCPPRNMSSEDFDWTKYLQDTGCEAVPGNLFREIKSPTHKFETNMKLEAVDRKNPDLVCVSSVNNVIGEHFLIHFDEWDDQYDYYCREDSPFIHEVGWCAESNIPLVPPTDEMINIFKWETYLQETNAIPAPKSIFNPRPEPDVEIGSKLEVIDPRNPSVLRVATVCEVEQHQIKIHFDGWDSSLDYWFDSDSPDLHPVNWHKKVGHPIDPPPTKKDTESLCGIIGCRGVGHIKGVKYSTHHTMFGCPYAPCNINRSSAPPVDRLDPNALGEEKSFITRIHNKKKGIPLDPSLIDPQTVGDNGRPKVKPKRKYKRRDDTSTPVPVSKDSFVSCPVKPTPPTHIPANQNNLVPSGKAVPWTVDAVVKFLFDIGCGEFASHFSDNQIDGQALLLLSQTDLVRHLKLKLGPALKIYEEISKL